MGSTIRADLAPVTDLADDLAGQLLNDMLGDISLEVKKQALHIGEKVTGGDLRLSGFGGKKSRGKSKLGVKYEVTGKRSTIDMKPAALWALTTEGASPHMIGAGRRTKSGKTTRQRGRPILKIGNAVITGPVRHPGTRGKASLDRVYAQIPRICTEIVEEALGKAVK